MSEDKICSSANALYNAIHKYYYLLIDSMNEDDYNSIKNVLGYTDNYEEHINYVKSYIKQKTDTIEHIKSFLSTYIEFQRKHYAKSINNICDKIEENPSKFKEIAYKGILQFADEHLLSEEIESDSGDGGSDCGSDCGSESELKNDIDDGSEPENDNSESDELECDELDSEVVYNINGAIIELKVYKDPLLRCLYDVLFIIFETENSY